MARGVFEPVNGSGVWYVRYADSTGKIRREKAGTRSMATLLYLKRKAEALQGRKLPEKLQRRDVPFSALIEDALAYSKGHKRSYTDDVCHMGIIKKWLGDLPVDVVTA